MTDLDEAAEQVDTPELLLGMQRARPLVETLFFFFFFFFFRAVPHANRGS